MNGFLLINKPKDWTSHDVVGYLRGITRIKKIGHAGTLDPFATGLLILGVSREATKRLDEFKGMPKTYIATLKLGATSTTYDTEGVITENETCNMKHVTDDKIQEVVKNFEGKQEQLPPMYSAKKVGGKKLYDLARKGIEIERNPHEIEIYSIKVLEPLNQELRTLNLEVSCSTGTYIRTLAHDIGQKLGVGAYCVELERTRIGEFSVENADNPKKLTRDNWENKLLQL